MSLFHLMKSTHRQVFNYSFFVGPSFIRSWKFGMFSDSESTGGSSESRSLDSESISPGICIFKSNWKFSERLKLSIWNIFNEHIFRMIYLWLKKIYIHMCNLKKNDETFMWNHHLAQQVVHEKPHWYTYISNIHTYNTYTHMYICAHICMYIYTCVCYICVRVCVSPPIPPE